MLTVETGEGLPGAESFASVADADAYLGDRGHTAWAALAEPAKEAALRLATDYLEAVYGPLWLSERRTEAQGLSWPRVGWPGVPAPVRNACAELALRAASGPLMPDQGPAVQSEQVGPLLVAYQDGARQGVRYVLVDKMLAPYLSAQRVQAVRA